MFYINLEAIIELKPATFFLIADRTPLRFPVYFTLASYEKFSVAS